MTPLPREGKLLYNTLQPTPHAGVMKLVDVVDSKANSSDSLLCHLTP